MNVTFPYERVADDLRGALTRLDEAAQTARITEAERDKRFAEIERYLRQHGAWLGRGERGGLREQWSTHTERSGILARMDELYRTLWSADSPDAREQANDAIAACFEKLKRLR